MIKFIVRKKESKVDKVQWLEKELLTKYVIERGKKENNKKKGKKRSNWTI